MVSRISSYLFKKLYLLFQVATLFYDHPDLLDEFTRFLPNNSEVPVVQNLPYGRAPAPLCGERSSVVPISRQMHADKVIS